MTIRLSYETALRHLTAAARENPDLVYSYVKDADGHDECAYFDPATEAPSCIVGQVFAREGYTIRDLDDTLLGGYCDTLANYAGVDTLISNGVLEVDDATEKLLADVQALQDSMDVRWVEAVRRAAPLQDEFVLID